MTVGGFAGQTGPADEELEKDQLKWTSSDSTHVSRPSQLQCVCVCVGVCVRVCVERVVTAISNARESTYTINNSTFVSTQYTK